MHKNKYIFIALSVLILLSGIFIRFYKLNVIPPGIHYDEAYNGVDALKALESGDYKVFYESNYGREGFHINAIAFFLGIFGNTNLGLRFANALWGSLTLIGFYFLLRELRFSRLSVLAGTFMLSFSFWHLAFSRTAYRAIMVPMVLVWAFYFFWKAINNPKRRNFYFILAGIIFGLGFHTYIAFRIAPLIAIFVILSFALGKKDFFRKYWKNGLFLAAATFVIFLPILIFFSDHIRDFVSRSEAVSIFNAPKGLTVWQALWKSLSTHLLAFFAFGDNNPRHNYNGQPLLPAAWAVLFSLGFIISIQEIIRTFANLVKSKKNPERTFGVTKWFHVSVLAQSIFWVMLVPGVMSIEGIPHSLRIIGVIPGVFILAVLPLEYFLSLYRSQQKDNLVIWKKNNFLTIFIGLVALVAIGGIIQVYTYFGLWAKDLRTYGAYERKLYDAGFLVKDTAFHRNNYFITAYNTWISPDQRQSSLKTMEFVSWPKSKKLVYYRPMDGFSNISCDDPMIVFLESDQWLRDQYKSKCPGLAQQKFTYDNGKYVFWVMANKK